MMTPEAPLQLSLSTQPAGQVAASKYREQQSTVLRSHETFGPSVGTQIPTCKRALCMPSSYANPAISTCH